MVSSDVSRLLDMWEEAKLLLAVKKMDCSGGSEVLKVDFKIAQCIKLAISSSNNVKD